MSNWINFEIEGKKYHLLCKFNENSDWDCLLYDGNESWYEKQLVETVIARAKEQNRRIQYDEATIKETLQSGEPTEAAWLEDENSDADGDDDDGAVVSKRLKLKYNVKSCPFNFTWHLSKQTEHDFLKFILCPLLRIVQGLTQQNKELRDIVRKKDIEIKQYKLEFGLINRVTVSTAIFNASEFDERFAETLELSKCMMQISDLLNAQYSEMKTPLEAKSFDKANDNVAVKRQEELKLTPRRKRRKLIEEKQRVIAEKIKAVKKPFAYECSQSEVSTISPSDNDAPSTSKRLLRTPKKNDELKIENDLDETPTKRNRTSKSSDDQSPVKMIKRNLNFGIQYDDSSDDETINAKTSHKNPSPPTQQTKTDEKANIEAAMNLTPSTRSRASTGSSLQKCNVKLTKITGDNDGDTTATLTGKSAGIYDYNESTDEEMKTRSKSPNKKLSQQAKQTNTTEQAHISKPDLSVSTRSSTSIEPVSPVKSAKRGRPPTKKNAGIEYEDSSESAAEEKSNKESITTLSTTPIRDSNSKSAQSPEQLSDDVQNIIDEWKALEKRRLADLKIRQK